MLVIIIVTLAHSTSLPSTIANTTSSLPNSPSETIPVRIRVYIPPLSTSLDMFFTLPSTFCFCRVVGNKKKHAKMQCWSEEWREERDGGGVECGGF